MKSIAPRFMTTLVLAFCFAFITSCTKDSDLFFETVLPEDTEVEDVEANEDEDANEGEDAEESDENDNGDSNDNTEDQDSSDSNEGQGTVGLDDFQEAEPNNIVGTFHPKSAAEITDPSKANYKAIIDNSFNCDACVFAKDLTIEPAGGIISGRLINVNGAFITDNFKQAFASDAALTEPYKKTRLSPDIFGGFANDNTADDTAITALIANAAFATGQNNGVYIKNQETIHKRNGTFDWQMNGSIVRTTNGSALSHGSGTQNQNKYLFEFTNLNLKLTYGEFDGKNIASRLFRLFGVQSYLLDNINIHDYYAPPNAYARGVAISLEIRDNFTDGKLLNSTIKNIGAASDGNANNAPYGISKGISMSIKTQNESNQLVEGCTIENIYGDDAEGFYNAPGFGYGVYNYTTNRVGITFNENTFKACQRRALKVNASNCQITNNYIESATNDWIFSGAQAPLVHVFSIKNDQPVRNVNISNNTVKTIGEARNPGFGITDATECLIENNNFEADYIVMQRNISFAATGTQGGLYTGDLSDSVVFRNNTIVNYFVNLPPVYSPVNGGFKFEDNIIDIKIDRNIGGYWAAFRFPTTSGDTKSYTFKNITINVNQTFHTGSLFGGVIFSQGVNLKNITLDNVDINFSGNSLPVFPYAIAGLDSNPANFDSSNKIIDCDINGAIGTGAINSTGSNKSVVIENSFGDGGTPITAI